MPFVDSGNDLGSVPSSAESAVGLQSSFRLIQATEVMRSMEFSFSGRSSLECCSKALRKALKTPRGPPCGLSGTSIPAAISAFGQDPKMRSAAENRAA